MRLAKLPPMRRLNAFALGLTLFALGTSPGDAADSASPEGYWVMRGYVIQVERCGAGICGQLVALRPGRNPETALDRKNPDPQRRTRLLCGLELFGGFRQARNDRAKWEGGWIYNPEDGRTYSSEFRVDGPDTLKVRGYFLTPLIGRTVTLSREAEPQSRCPDLLHSAGGAQQATNEAPITR